jgi:hypothetical protein
MENSDTNELIEPYLNGSLTPAQQEAVEARLAADAAFRAEVDLHRQLHGELEDPQKLLLRDLLTGIVREPPPARPGWLPVLGIGLAILLTAWLGWRWLSSSGGRKAEPARQEEFKSPPSPSEPIPGPETPQKSPEPAQKTIKNPIARADPAAFEPNRDFEDRLGSKLRTTGGSARMESPAMGANFSPQNGFVKIHFQGTAPADVDTAKFPLVLKIYNNRPVAGQPVFRVLPFITNRSLATEHWTFSSSQRWRLPPGLYYYLVERQTDEDLIFVGKFTVGAR